MAAIHSTLGDSFCSDFFYYGVVNWDKIINFVRLKFVFGTCGHYLGWGGALCVRVFGHDIMLTRTE